MLKLAEMEKLVDSVEIGGIAMEETGRVTEEMGKILDLFHMVKFKNIAN